MKPRLILLSISKLRMPKKSSEICAEARTLSQNYRKREKINF